MPRDLEAAFHQKALEIGLRLAKSPVLVDREHNGHLLPMPRDHLGPLVEDSVDELAQALFGCLQLPDHATSAV